MHFKSFCFALLDHFTEFTEASDHLTSKLGFDDYFIIMQHITMQTKSLFSFINWAKWICGIKRVCSENHHMMLAAGWSYQFMWTEMESNCGLIVYVNLTFFELIFLQVLIVFRLNLKDPSHFISLWHAQNYIHRKIIKNQFIINACILHPV